MSTPLGTQTKQLITRCHWPCTNFSLHAGRYWKVMGNKKCLIYINWRARSAAVGCSIALQIGRSRVRFPMVSLECFIDTILSAALWLLKEMSTKDSSWVVKAAGVYSWQTYHLHVPTVLKSESFKFLEPSATVQTCTGFSLTLQPLRDETWIFLCARLQAIQYKNIRSLLAYPLQRRNV